MYLEDIRELSLMSPDEINHYCGIKSCPKNAPLAARPT